MVKIINHNIDAICKQYGIENYTINSDGSIDVNGNVDLRDKNLTALPLRFNYVDGHFYCYNNQLTNLQGSPREVGGSFYCYNNLLTNLQGGPREVSGGFYCYRNGFKVEPDHSFIAIGGEFVWR